MTAKLARITASIATFCEKYVLSLVFLYLATVELNKTWGVLTGQLAVETTFFIDAAHHVILLLLGVFTSLLLFFAHRPAAPPQKLSLVLLPLATTFFSPLYYLVSKFPATLQINLSPPGLRAALVTAGLSLIIIGPFLAFWGILYLGRSFGVFITVRRVVLTGPYQWVRHPMYLGWICVCIGVALANFSGAYLLLVTVHISLLLYRAHLEESQLARHSVQYREYMKQAGFIFPKFGHHAIAPLKAR